MEDVQVVGHRIVDLRRGQADLPSVVPLAWDQARAISAAWRRAARLLGARSCDILTSSHWLKRDMLYVKIQ